MSLWRRLLPLSLLGLGYALAMAPWFARNYALLGTPLPGAPSRTAFLQRYDEIFSYALEPSAARWLARDATTLIAERGGAALQVLLQFLGTFQWVIPPLALLGWWRAAPAGRARVAPGAHYALLLVPTMALVFPHPAQYGTLFRGASALVPWGMALVPAGLEHAARAYARLRHGCERTALAVFRPGLLLITVLVAALFHFHRLHGILPQADRLWNQHLTHYREVADWLRTQGAKGPVLVVDPPGYTLATGLPSIVVPSDGARAVREAADRYGARWLLLEANVPSLEAAWRGRAPLDGFVSVREFQDEVGSPVRLMLRTP